MRANTRSSTRPVPTPSVARTVAAPSAAVYTRSPSSPGTPGIVRLWTSTRPSPAATPEVAYTTVPVGSVTIPAHPESKPSTLAVASNPSRIPLYALANRVRTASPVDGRNIGEAPPSTNSQSS